MKKFIFICSIFLFLSFNIFTLPSMADPSIVAKRGIYTIERLNLSPDTIYNVQNTSFNDRIYILVFDTDINIIQSIRLWPQSPKLNLVPLKPGYKIVVTGNGEVTIS